VKPFLRTVLLVASLIVLCACVFSFAGDADSRGDDSHSNDTQGSDSHRSAFRGREFNGVVHAIEDHYGVRRTHIPFLSFAMLFARPAGVSGLKLAVFEDFHSSDAASMNDDLQHVVEHSLSSDWHLFVRTRSRDDGDNTLIYVNLGDGKMQMMIVAIEPNEATVVEMNLSERALRRWIDEPKESAKDQSGHQRHLAED
jgi:hypothetical protein